jgi:cytochrome c-type biogenesis protein CcmH/NrfG
LSGRHSHVHAEEPSRRDPHGHGGPVTWDPTPARSRKGVLALVAGALLIALGAWMWRTGRRMDSAAESRELEDAIAAAERAVAESPERWEPLAELARLEARSGDIESARRALDRARDLAPDEPRLAEMSAEIDGAAKR